MNVAIAGRLVVLLVLAVPQVVNAGSGDETLLYGRTLDGGEIAAVCFARRYDEAHLGGHPHQNVSAVKLLAYRPDWPSARSIVNLEFRFRGVDEPFQLSGECRFAPKGAEYLQCGIECDGGSFSLRRAGSGGLLVDVPEALRLCDGDEDIPSGAAFGADDTLFRLDSAALEACDALIFDDEIRPKLDALR